MCEKTVWGIHSRDDALFLNKSVIAINFMAAYDLSLVEKTRDSFRIAYTNSEPDAPKGRIATNTGQIYRFVCEVKPGDFVVFPSKVDRMINIGEVTGEYEYDTDSARNQGYPHRHAVKWLKHLPRTAFTQGALYEVGSALTIFEVKNYADEFMEALAGNSKNTSLKPTDDETVAATADEIQQSTVDFIIKSLSTNQKGYPLEDFVADLMNAMGYRTIVSQHGGDRGIDITAYKDELPPRIVVQVKSQDSDVNESMLQSLRGAMREGDYGVFVALSSYKKNAQQYLEANPIIRGINGQELAMLVMKYYDGLSDKYKKIIPLKMVYIADPEEE